jgi:hypothetical protein
MKRLILLLLIAAAPMCAQFGSNATRLRGKPLCASVATPTDAQALVYDASAGCYKAGTAGGGTTPYSCTVTAVSSIACTHSLSTSTPLVACYDGSGNLLGSTGASTSVTSIVGTSSSVATITFSGSTTGTCLISTGGVGAPGAAGSTGATGSAGSTGAAGAGYAATSTTSLATAGSGSKSFTTQSGLAYTVGARIRATSAGTAEWMEGVVTSYATTTLAATMDLNSGTGTHADWNINLAGERGATGATGSAGATGATGPAGPTGSGSGDVLGPATNTDLFVPQWDGANTKTLKNGIAVAQAATANTIAQRNSSGELIAANTVATGKTAMATDTAVQLSQLPASVTLTIASGTSALGTSAISANSCATVVTTSATGTATTDVITWTPNADISGVTGYAVASTDGLIIFPYPSSNNVNFKVCNGTASSITPGAVTLNWAVRR